MKNYGFFYKTVSPTARDCRAFVKKHLLVAILSLIWCILGIVLGIIECGKKGAEAFVVIYGNRFYLIATRSAGIGGVFSTEFIVGILIISSILLSTFSRYLLWVSDVLFSVACFLKTITIGYLMIEVGVISKILAITVLIPCFLLLIAWYCCFHAASCEFCPFGWKMGGFKRMFKCHNSHLIFFILIFIGIVVLQFLLFLFFCVLL
ncbi:MAG: hypothetical protein E7363_02390 [Clostridiales bacterium]|nr:hypothetical protein [Clostridiales bacterium]